jgi:hypothetical protein
VPAARFFREKRLSSPRTSRPMFARCSATTPTAAAPANTVTGHGYPSSQLQSGSDTAESIEATEA